MRRHLAGLVRHRRKTLLGLAEFDSVVGAGQSTFTADDNDITANSSSTATFTITARNGSWQAIPDLSATIAAEAIEVSAANSTVTASPVTIADDGVESSVVTLIARDASNRPIPNLPASDCVLAVSGSGNTLTQPTGSTNQDGVITASFVSTGAATKTASFTVRSIAITDTASVEVTGTPGLLTPVFQADFAAGDFSEWTTAPGVGEVVATTGLGFPAGMVNCMRVPWDQASAALGRKTGLGELAIGSTRVIRHYIRVDIPDGTVDTLTHYSQDGNPGSQTNYSVECFNNVGAGVYRPGLAPAFDEPVFARSRWLSTTNLTKGVVYRKEVVMVRLSSTTYQLHHNIFDDTISETVPILDDSDFRDRNDNGSSALLSLNPTFTFLNAANTDGLNMGCEENEPGVTGNHSYQGGWAVVDDQGTTIGPYGSVTGEG